MEISIPSDNEIEETERNTLSTNNTNSSRSFNAFFKSTKNSNKIYNAFAFPNNCIIPFRQICSTQISFTPSTMDVPNHTKNFMNSKPKSQSSINFNSNTDNLINVDDIISKKEKRTTIMLKFIPVKYNVEELIEEIDICLGTKENYRTFDLVYLPISFKNEKNLGYAFINFISPLYVLDFFFKSSELKWKKYHTNKNCIIRYAKVQGKINLLNHFKESPGEEKKPLLIDSSTNKIDNNYKIAIKKYYYEDVCSNWTNIDDFMFI